MPWNFGRTDEADNADGWGYQQHGILSVRRLYGAAGLVALHGANAPRSFVIADRWAAKAHSGLNPAAKAIALTCSGMACDRSTASRYSATAASASMVASKMPAAFRQSSITEPTTDSHFAMTCNKY